jgi:hypothetical protein
MKTISRLVRDFIMQNPGTTRKLIEEFIFANHPGHGKRDISVALRELQKKLGRVRPEGRGVRGNPKRYYLWHQPEPFQVMEVAA